MEDKLEQEIRSKEHWRNLYWEECEKNKKLSEENGQLKANNDRLVQNAMEDMKVQTELEEKIRFLEECLDRKEKVNKELREDIGKLVMKE